MDRLLVYAPACVCCEGASLIRSSVHDDRDAFSLILTIWNTANLAYMQRQRLVNSGSQSPLSSDYRRPLVVTSVGVARVSRMVRGWRRWLAKLALARFASARRRRQSVDSGQRTYGHGTDRDFVVLPHAEVVRVSPNIPSRREFMD